MYWDVSSIHCRTLDTWQLRVYRNLEEKYWWNREFGEKILSSVYTTNNGGVKVWPCTTETRVQIGEFTPACRVARWFLSGSVPPWQHAVRTSARRYVMMGQQHQNWVIDCYITVVPVESGWLLLKEIRVWGKLQNWVSSGMFGFCLFFCLETRSSHKS